MTTADDIVAIAIGRNEGKRLIACLDALLGQVGRIVYVDSGSTDNSVAEALARGVEVVDLDLSTPFTAARARNAGLEHLSAAEQTRPTFVQFLDGDCVMVDDWLPKAYAFLKDNPKVAAVCGRRREMYPDTSVYNQLIDAEWDTPIGETKSCGGDVLMRLEALDSVGNFDPSLIAGEEPELCVRLRAKGWAIHRLDAEMTLHDADLTKFGQWWRRSKRGGFAYAEGAAMHGAPPERHKVSELRRALAWGAGLPLLTLFGLLITPAALLLLLVWPAQMLRLRGKGYPKIQAIFLTLAKLPEAQGALEYYLRQLRGDQIKLIEYK